MSRLSYTQRSALVTLTRFEGRFVGTKESNVMGSTLAALADRGLVELKATTKPYRRLVGRLTPAGVEAARKARAARPELAELDRIEAARVAAGVCRHCGGPVPCWSAFGDVEVGVKHEARS